MIFALLLSMNLQAADSALETAPAKSPVKSVDFSMLPRNEKIYTKETIVETDGVKYRKVEFQGQTFYMKLLGASADQDMRVLCAKPGKKESEPLISVGARMTERTSFFVEGLKVACTEGGFRADSDARLSLVAALSVGFRIDDSKTGPLSSFKNRRIFVGLGVLGFAAEAP